MHRIGCIICGSWEVDSCHIKSRGAGGSNESWNIFYACRLHHQEQHTIGIKRFAMKYEKFYKELIRKGWEMDSYTLKWQHVLEQPE